MDVYHGNMNSPLGTLSLFASDQGLVRILFPTEASENVFPESRIKELIIHWHQENDTVGAARRQLTEYFDKTRRQFDLPLHFVGTPFQKRVWQNLLKIPYGEVISYQELARLAGSPNGYRAVGSANSKNPLPIIVPCHRVIRKNGGLGGYGGGLSVKRRLLALEGVDVSRF